MIRGNNIGAMDVLLTIQQPTKTRHSVTHEEVLTWADWTTAWAEKVSMSYQQGPRSMEVYEAQQAVAKTVSHYRIRFLTGLTEDMRVVRDGTHEYISGIEEIDRKKFLILTTEKRDDGT